MVQLRPTYFRLANGTMNTARLFAGSSVPWPGRAGSRRTRGSLAIGPTVSAVASLGSAVHPVSATSMAGPSSYSMCSPSWSFVTESILGDGDPTARPASAAVRPALVSRMAPLEATGTTSTFGSPESIIAWATPTASSSAWSGVAPASGSAASAAKTAIVFGTTESDPRFQVEVPVPVPKTRKGIATVLSARFSSNVASGLKSSAVNFNERWPSS